ncbi:MAG: hypothetical protein J3Q66DRAFT_350979, partial [Benniella sp.]
MACTRLGVLLLIASTYNFSTWPHRFHIHDQNDPASQSSGKCRRVSFLSDVQQIDSFPVASSSMLTTLYPCMMLRLMFRLSSVVEHWFSRLLSLMNLVWAPCSLVWMSKLRRRGSVKAKIDCIFSDSRSMNR